MLNATRTTMRLGTLLLALLCAALPLQSARADEAPAAAPAAGPGAPAASEAEGPLKEIIVTATRREESLSKVPISVTALSQSDMDARGIKDMQDIVRFVPGVSIDTSGTNAISIRGISSSAGAGTTGIYIDDTPIQMRSLGFNPDDTLPKTFDLERVEVLRGPQGTLFGSGSEGGTVRYIMTQPSLTSTSSYVRSELAGTWYGEPSYELGAAHGEPVVDGVFGWRASAWYRYDGGWVDRVDPTTGEKLNRNIDRASTLVLRLAAVWQPASGFTVTPSIIYQNHDKNDAGTYWPAYSDPSAGKFKTATPERIPNPDEYFLPALKLQWDLAKSQIISNTSFYHRDEKTGYQGTVYDMAYYQSLGWPNNPNTLGLGCGPADQPAGGPAVTGPPCPWYPLMDANGLHFPAGFGNYQTPNVITNKQQSWVQEFRWQSSDPNERLHWTVGLFGQVAKESSIEELIDPQINPFFNALYGINATDLFGYTDTNGNFVSPYQCNGFGSYTAIPQCDIYYNSNTTWDRQIALYGELNYALSEHWRLTLGERVAHTTFEIHNYADGLENFGPTPVNGVSTPGVGRSASTSSNPNTPKASLAFQLDPSNMFYASYAKGFRVGGGNPELPSYCATDLATAGYPNGAPQLYSPDSTQNYEIGAKNVIGGVLRLATSVYYIDWSNIQQSVYVAGACGLQFTTNLGTAVSKGFDLQAQLALGQLFVDFAVGYNDARFTKDSLPPAGSPPLVSKGDAISGQAAIDYAPGTNPPWEIAVGPEYRFNIAQHEAFVRLDYTYESKNTWLAAVQDPRTSQFIPASYSYPATSFLSLRAGINIGEWQISPFIDNVLNSHTVTNYALGQVDPYNPNGSPSQQQNAYTFRPFTVGVTATWHVGGGGH